MPKVRLSNAHKEVLAELYHAARRTRDDLPYTDDFEQLYAEFIARTGRVISRHDLWTALASAGKASRLERKSRRGN